MAQVEMVVGMVAQGANGTSAINTMVSSTNSGTSSYVLANNIGQIVVSITSMVPVLAPIGVQTNTLAGTMTFLKIVGDIKAGATVDAGDVLTLVGNVAGVVATVAVLVGASPVALTAGAVGVLATVAGIGVTSGGVVDYTRGLLANLWPPSQPPLNLNDKWIDKEGRARRYDDIVNDPTSGFRMIRWDGTTVTVTETPEPPERRPEDQEVDGDGLE